jgi:hypothetical protein
MLHPAHEKAGTAFVAIPAHATCVTFVLLDSKPEKRRGVVAYGAEIVMVNGPCTEPSQSPEFMTQR